MSELGFKDINVDNWLDPDEVTSCFVGRVNSQTYVGDLLSVELSESVPKDIRALFEVARGAMIYGYLFYPLYTLAAEQLFRVAEAGLRQRYAELKVPKEKRLFKTFIEWLTEEGHLSSIDADRWHALRGLRNSASHPMRQAILTPGSAMDTLATVAEDLNSLFADA